MVVRTYYLESTIKGTSIACIIADVNLVASSEIICLGDYLVIYVGVEWSYSLQLLAFWDYCLEFVTLVWVVYHVFF